jgi:hypothetical protein
MVWGQFGMRSNLSAAWLGLFLSLAIPSAMVTHKYLGLAGLAGYLLVTACTLAAIVAYREGVLRFARRLTGAQIGGLAAATLAAVTVVFFVVYPIANSGAQGGGSDGDDALHTATSELLHGRYPYSTTTYLGNPITPMPGALLLAIPFVLAGNAAYQNIFWLAMFFLVARGLLKDVRSALLLLWAILLLSPTVMHTIVIGIDYVANGLYVLVFSVWAVASVARAGSKPWYRIGSAALLGIGLSSRANFLFLLPVLFAAERRSGSWRAAVQSTTITIAVFLAVTLPFYLVDPEAFSPFHTARKFESLDNVLPKATAVIACATAVLALWLASRRSRCAGLIGMLRDCAIVLAFPVCWIMLLASVETGRLDVEPAIFGTFFVFLGATAAWGILSGIDRSVTPPADAPRR